MSKFNSFAVWGAGNLGRHLVTELLSYKNVNPEIRVTVLARHESKDSEKNAALSTAGATIVAWDPASPNASDDLKDIEVFICAVSGHAAPLQVPAAHAAQKAGVKVFIPNDWGTDPFAADSLWHQAQQTARAGAVAAGIPVTSFNCGFWPDVLPGFGFDIKAGKIDIAGDGSAHLSLTGTQDSARFAAYALANLARDDLVGKTFQYQAEYITSLELAHELQKASPKPLEIVHTSVDALKTELAERQAQGAFLPTLITGCRLSFAAGAWQLDQGKLDNGIWPQWKPKRAVEVMKEFF